MRFIAAFVAIAAVATTASASWAWKSKATPGPNTGSGGMRQQTQTTGWFAQRVRGANYHIAALESPEAQIYRDMQLGREQLRVIQWYINLYFPHIDEEALTPTLEIIKEKMAILVELAQKIAVENQDTKDLFLKKLVESHLVAFRVKFEIVKLNIKAVSFLTHVVRKGLPAFKKNVNKHVGRTYKKARKVGGQAAHGAKHVGGKALTGAKTAGDYFSRTGANIYKKLGGWYAEIKTRGWNQLVNWSGLDQEDFDDLVVQTDEQYENIEEDEDEGLYEVKGQQWQTHAEPQQLQKYQ